MKVVGEQVGVKMIVESMDVVMVVLEVWWFSELGDVILFFLVNVSWDQFFNFEVCGDWFIEVVE